MLQNTKCQSNLGTAASSPLTQRIPLVTMGCPTFTTKTASSPSTISTSFQYTYSSTDPSDHSKRHPDPISHFVTVQTDRHGISDRPVRIPSSLILYSIIFNYILATRLIITIEVHVCTPIMSFGEVSCVGQWMTCLTVWGRSPTGRGKCFWGIGLCNVTYRKNVALLCGCILPAAE